MAMGREFQLSILKIPEEEHDHHRRARYMRELLDHVSRMRDGRILDFGAHPPLFVL